VLDPVAETKEVASQEPQLGGGGRRLAIVPYVHLGREDAAEASGKRAG
jgi:hypothetical protein